MTVSIPITPPHVSVNRVKIIDLPGLPVDDGVRGQMAYHLLSVLAVTRYARERAEALELPAAFAQNTTQTRLELPRFVDGCLSSPSESVRAAARAIGQRLGRNLGYILLTLHRSELGLILRKVLFPSLDVISLLPDGDAARSGV